MGEREWLTAQAGMTQVPPTAAAEDGWLPVSLTHPLSPVAETASPEMRHIEVASKSTS